MDWRLEEHAAKMRERNATTMVERLQHTDPMNADQLWASEACFICGTFGRCQHRELTVASARIEGMRKRQEQRERQLMRRAVYLEETHRSSE